MQIIQSVWKTAMKNMCTESWSRTYRFGWIKNGWKNYHKSCSSHLLWINKFKLQEIAVDTILPMKDLTIVPINDVIFHEHVENLEVIHILVSLQESILFEDCWTPEKQKSRKNRCSSQLPETNCLSKEYHKKAALRSFWFSSMFFGIYKNQITEDHKNIYISSQDWRDYYLKMEKEKTKKLKK